MKLKHLLLIVSLIITVLYSNSALAGFKKAKRILACFYNETKIQENELKQCPTCKLPYKTPTHECKSRYCNFCDKMVNLKTFNLQTQSCFRCHGKFLISSKKSQKDHLRF